MVKPRKLARAGKDGPALYIRFRSRKDISRIKRVAKSMGMSINSYILTEVMSQVKLAETRDTI